MWIIKLDVADAVSKLIIPGFIDQLSSMRKVSNIRMKQPNLCAYNFCPPRFLHPLTVVYDLSFGETKMKESRLYRGENAQSTKHFDQLREYIGLMQAIHTSFGE
jgi:hypothetical protein